MKRFKITFLGRYRGTHGAFSTFAVIQNGRDAAHAEERFYYDNGDTFESNAILSVEELGAIKIKSILLKDGEGKRAWFPKTFGSWEAFEEGMRAIQRDIIADYGGKWGGGYWKLDFVITWEDGETYEGRYDLSAPEKMQSLKSHVRNHCRFHGGIWKPAHLVIADYLACVKTYQTRGVTEQGFVEYLAKYDL